MKAIEALTSVLCDPEGKCCISGSDDDRRLIDSALAELAQAAQTDRVQEDAACWHWLAEYLVGTRTDLDDEIVASETVNDLRNLVKAAMGSRTTA